MKLLLIFLFILFLSCPSCEKIEYYIPKPECTSDWLTNPVYHRPVQVITVGKNAPDIFSATVNGTRWKADSGIYAYYYKGRGYINGRNKDYAVSISFTNDDPSGATFNLLFYKTNSAYSYSIKEKSLSNINYDAESNTLSLNFSIRCEVLYQNNGSTASFAFENGAVQNAKCEVLFCRPVYKEENSLSPRAGEWNLIEITDCNTNSQYFPPCYYKTGIYLDTIVNNPEYHSLYKYTLHAWCGNESSPSYEYLNDTTIITSSGGATQIGMTAEGHDFEGMFFTLMNSNTLIIKQKNNLLELKTLNNIFLRFYKGTDTWDYKK
jgi:hypothetical protein